MMKTIVGVVLCGMFFIYSNAQSVLCSVPVKNKVNTNPVSIVGKDDSGYYAFEKHEKESLIKLSHYFYNDLKSDWTKTIEYGKGYPDARFENLIAVKEGLLLFISSFNKENEQLQVYCTMIDKSGNVLGDPALVHYILSEGREFSPQFGVEVSPNKEKILIFFDPPFERKSTEALSFRCYDNDLDMLWDKEILLPYSSDMIQVHQFVLDNDANLYMLSGRKRPNGFSKLVKPESGRYIMFYYNAKENKLKEYDLTLKEKQITSIQMRFDNSGNLSIAGYYALDYKINVIGTFYYSIAAKGGGVLAASFMPFKKDFISKFRLTDGQDILPDFYLNEVVYLSDGSILMLGERQYMTEEIVFDQATGRNIVEIRYHFDDIIVSKLEPSGRHIWNSKIPKEQYSTTSGFTNYSFNWATDQSSLQLYFNDNIQNQERLKSMHDGLAAPWSGTNNSNTSKVTVSEAGTILREVLFSNKEKGALLNTQVAEGYGTLPVVLGYSSTSEYKFCLGN